MQTIYRLAPHSVPTEVVKEGGERCSPHIVVGKVSVGLGRSCSSYETTRHSAVKKASGENLPMSFETPQKKQSFLSGTVFSVHRSLWLKIFSMQICSILLYTCWCMMGFPAPPHPFFSTDLLKAKPNAGDVCKYKPKMWLWASLFRAGGWSAGRSAGSWGTTNCARHDGKDPTGPPELRSRCATPALGSRVHRRLTRTLGLFRQQWLWQQLGQRR